MSEKSEKMVIFWRGNSGEQSAVFTLTTKQRHVSAKKRKHPEALCENSVPPA
jgi:hypothetical protein